MKVVTAIEKFTSESFGINCFLAGGITNCWNWQDAVLDALSKYDARDLIVFNPRRPNFPIEDPNAAYEQIQWEFNCLEACDIFSMYFAAGDSDQPICMYELGRNLISMQWKFRRTYMDRIVITCEPGYHRQQDVEIQSKLALGKNIMTAVPTPEEHALRIIE